MSHLYSTFLQHVPDKGHILDLGCGSGRDSKHFLDKGYRVTAIDGIWACASLLHVDRISIKDVLTRLHHALKSGGAMYLSFEEGTGEREKDGRFFNDYT